MLVDVATPDDFEKKAFQNAQPLTVVYFWGPQCPNCEVFARHLPAILKTMEKDPIQLIKVNAYEHTELATRFGLYGIPTFLVVRQGRVVGRMTSFTSEEFFVTVLREQLEKGVTPA
jgi:thioredoxin-like negative regulator of GroEL